MPGPVQLRTLNLDGDRQADLAVHGGPFKAVYAYPSEHYEFWRKELPGTQLPWGMFGENFTTEGLFEKDLHIGDRLQIGSAIIMVRQPRIPCYKLAVKFQPERYPRAIPAQRLAAGSIFPSSRKARSRREIRSSS